MASYSFIDQGQEIDAIYRSATLVYCTYHYRVGLSQLSENVSWHRRSHSKNLGNLCVSIFFHNEQHGCVSRDAAIPAQVIIWYATYAACQARANASHRPPHGVEKVRVEPWGRRLLNFLSRTVRGCCPNKKTSFRGNCSFNSLTALHPRPNSM